MNNWLINGEAGDAIKIDDRAVQYGDGLFETIAIRCAEPRFWPLHFERLQNGCARLSLDAPDEAQLKHELHMALQISGADPEFAVAKIIITAGQGPRGYRRPRDCTNTRMVRVFASRPRPRSDYENGVAVTRCQTRLAQQPQLAGIKTLNRLEQVLGQNELHDTEFAEGLMLDTDDRLVCGTMSNVFLVKKNKVYTPAITRCGVSGVMRRKIIEIMEARHIEYEVIDIGRDTVSSADELFLSNSQFGLLPVRQYEETRFAAGEQTLRIMRALVEQGVTESSA
jgi:4-amino-4-deoxychorismate lyase